MPLTILPSGPQRVSPGVDLLKNIGTGLGEGLTRLAHHKMQKLERDSFVKNLSSLGYSPEQAQVLEYLQRQSPQQFHQILSQANPMQRQGEAGQLSQQAFGGGKHQSQAQTQAQELRVEARKDKLRPELTYLNELETTAKELKDLINDKQEPVEFGLQSAALSNIPLVGSQFLGKNTGAFDALSNKFHTDATQGSKNVRSVYHVKILGASKPSLNKTKEQNEKLLDYWQKVIDKKRAAFLKAHPEFLNEVENSEQQQSQQLQEPVQQQVSQQMQQSAQPRFRKNAKGQVQQWDPVSQSYKDL